MDITIIRFLFMTMVLSVMVNMALSLYGIFVRPSLIKKIIALSILGDSVNVFVTAIAFVIKYPYTVPAIYTNTTDISEESMRVFASLAADPVPPALVLTAIVIGLAVSLFLMFLTLQIYRLYGTTDVRKVARLRG